MCHAEIVWRRLANITILTYVQGCLGQPADGDICDKRHPTIVYVVTSDCYAFREISVS